MRYLDHVCSHPHEYVAFDEALLDACEAGEAPELLWCWEPRTHFVVLGYADPIRSEVNRAACEARRIPIVRRCSGGGAVLQGPGCLNFSLLLAIDPHGPLATLQGTTAFVTARHQQVLRELLGRPVDIEGGDLVLGSLKCSGSAQRRRQRVALFHGTFLLSLDLELMEQVLPMPSKQPDYRRRRPHRQFVANLPLRADQLISALRQAWSATEPFTRPPVARTQQLLAARYTTEEWTWKR